ncbi:MAG: proline--tRNA ligase [Anaerolineae bacterium]|nr:proline--tRNA ligase [Anaerolineae bacterium]
MEQRLASHSEDFSGWYNDVVQRADLADYSPVRGCMVIKPYGYELWEAVKGGLDRRFKETGHVNAYFPLFIPMSFLEKESEHVEGFSPQLAVVTHGGGKQLEEPLVVRPTSETIIGHMYAQWVQSYRDLPLLINQWANVVRWELRTRLFLRTMEFLWQEGHTVHATYEEAQEETLRILDLYADFARHDAAIPVLMGRKSETEKFPGALASYSIEAMMGDKRALQAGTSHNLGQNFAKAFEVTFLDEHNETRYCWGTSWGVSTRMVGAIIMVHGDAQGLRLPPLLAPVQVVVVPIYRSEDEKSLVLENLAALVRELEEAGVRVHLDQREEYTPGWKFNDWEMRGVPLRIEVGPREVAEEKLTCARRDAPRGKAKQSVARAEVRAEVAKLLVEIQQSLHDQALSFRDANIKEARDYAEFKEIVQDGWAYAWWCGGPDCESRIQEETTATSRCIPLDQDGGEGPCIYCGEKSRERAYFARAY